LEDLESSLRLIESFLPGLNLDPFFSLKLKDIDRSLNNFTKSSIQTFNSINLILGQSTEPDLSPLKSLELNFETYQSLFESLSKQLTSLQSLETSKFQIIETQALTIQIKSIDDLLNSHFLSSEKDKEEACSRLKRLSRSSSDFSYLSSSVIFEIDSSQKSLKQNIEILEQKVKNYLKINKQQDRLVLEMTEKIAFFDQVLDEIEIKFQEFVAGEVKDLGKALISADVGIKAILEKTNEKLISYCEETQKDFSQRLKSFLEKVLLTEELEKVKSWARDLQNKEIARIKAENQEKINEISNKLDATENERLLMMNSLNTNKSQLLLVSGMKEELMKSSNEKDLLVASLKNNVASLEEKLQQNNEDKEKLQEEVDDLQKDLRECKKMLRNKEYEIAELRESIGKSE
jgi:DNA repair exonuclease SbcCD ATPase subunit